MVDLVRFMNKIKFQLKKYICYFLLSSAQTYKDMN